MGGTKSQHGPGEEPGWIGSSHHGHLLKQSIRFLMVAAPPQLTPRYTLRVHLGPACPVVWLPSRVVAPETGGSDRLWGKGDLNPKVCMNGTRNQLGVPAMAAHQRQLRLLSAADMSPEPSQAPLASVLPHSGAKVLVQREGGKHILKDNRTSSGQTPRASTPAT